MTERDKTTVRANRSDALPPSGSARLHVFSVEPQSYREVVLDGGDELLIGRDVSDGNLRLDDQKSSRLHARIIWDARGSAHFLGDAGSKNGIFVNGRPVKSVALSSGDVARIGDSFLVYDSSPAGAFEEALKDANGSSLNVLLLGETGSGKEVTARAIHGRNRPGQAFVAVNCAALPRELVVSELFGHAKGAFSGAASARTGLFVEANDGTLFLDEIGDMPIELQPVLLRTLQDGKVRPVGSERELAVNTRVIAATNRDMSDSVTSGRFRRDLYARLSQIELHLPPLRAQRQRIPRLLHELGVNNGRRMSIAADALEKLLVWHWPQNVRELEVLVVRFLARHPEDATLDVADLRSLHPQLMVERRASVASDSGGEQPEAGAANALRETLRQLLVETKGNVSEVAERMGKPRAQIYRWIRRYGLPLDDLRE